MHWLHNLHFCQTWASFVSTFKEQLEELLGSVTQRRENVIHLIMMVTRKMKRIFQQMLPFPFPDSSVSSWFVMPCLRCLWLWIIKVTRKHLWEHHHQHLHCTPRLHSSHTSDLQWCICSGRATVLQTQVLECKCSGIPLEVNVPFSPVFDSNPFSTEYYGVAKYQSVAAE